LFAQLIADAKLLYNVDIQLISTRLLALKDKLILESIRRHKKNSDYVQSYKMRLEETVSQELQDGINFHSTSSLMHSHLVINIISFGLVRRNCLMLYISNVIVQLPLSFFSILKLNQKWLNVANCTTYIKLMNFLSDSQNLSGLSFISEISCGKGITAY